MTKPLSINEVNANETYAEFRLRTGAGREITRNWLTRSVMAGAIVTNAPATYWGDFYDAWPGATEHAICGR